MDERMTKQKVARLKLVADGLRRIQEFESARYLDEFAAHLTQPSQAEGCEHDWSIGYGVPRSSGFIPYCRKCGDPMPSTTQATPNAHE